MGGSCGCLAGVGASSSRASKPQLAGELFDRCELHHLTTDGSCNRHSGLGQDTEANRFSTESHRLSVPELRSHQTAVHKSRFEHFYDVSSYQPLGRGGFGDVYLSKKKATEEPVAIKVVKKKGLDVPSIKAELVSLINLDHPNVINMYEYFEDSHTIIIVMEKLGDDLTSIRESTPVSSTFQQLLRGLSYCHGNHIVHCDLKLENILFADESQALIKLIDFGLADVVTSNGTQTRAAKGTLLCMSPEMIQIIQGSSIWQTAASTDGYTSKTDIWSAGVILFMLLTGTHPYEGYRDSNEKLMASIVGQPIDTAPLQECQVGAEAQELVLSMLQKDPTLRPSAAEILQSRDDAWFGVCESPGSKVNAALQRVCKFRRDIFETAVLTIMAHHTHTQDAMDLKKAFEQLDTDGSGTLSKPEVMSGLKTAGMDISREELDSIFSAFGDEGGSISYTSWLAATLDPERLRSENVIKDAFDYFDADSSGTINKAELELVIDKQTAEQVLAKYDKNGDGQLDFPDFMHLVEHLAKEPGSICNCCHRGVTGASTPSSARVVENSLVMFHAGASSMHSGNRYQV